MVKNATDPVHQEVEALLLPKLSGIKSKEDYAAVLRMFYGYFSPLESQIAALIDLALLPDIAERRKAASLLHDLEAIRQLAGELPLCTGLPPLNTTAQALGAFYVLEGSTLGGKMIARMLRANEALAVSDEALTFFSGYGEQTGSKWKTFLTVLNNQPEADEIIASATETFRCLKRWMQHLSTNG